MSRKALRARARFRNRVRRANIVVAGALAALVAVAGFAIAPAIASSSSPAPANVSRTSTVGIFSDHLRPKIAADPDRVAVELGVRFSPQTSGTLTAVQYYQGKKAAGVKSATVWSASGKALARVSFTPTKSTGWRTVALKKPVKLVAGHTYVVSYNAPRGGYVVTEGDFTKTRTQNGFTLEPGAGVYRYGHTSTMPTWTYRGSNYLVDIVYKPSRSADPVTAPKPTATPTVTPTPKPTTTPKPTATATTKPSPTPTATPATPSSPGGISVLGRTFPNSATTGVPAGTKLTAYTGPCTIQTAGTVIDGKQVDCYLRILAKNVVIKNSVINGGVYADYNDNIGSFTITDSEVNGGDGPGTGIGDAYFTATRVEVTGGTRSINCYANCTVRDSYVHGQWADRSGVNHESGIRFNTNSTLIHNTIACDAPDFPPDAGCSAAITGYPDFDPVQNVTIDSNLIIAGSGGYCAYGGSTTGKPYSGQTKDIRFTNNVWQRGTEMGDGGRGYVCGFWGPITSFDSAAPGAVWSNNLYDDGTKVAPAN